MAFGTVAGLACLIGGLSFAAGPMLSVVLIVAGIWGGGRLVIKGIHRKAADIRARAEA